MNREMRQVLAELELLSHGKSASYNSSGGGESDAVVPQGEAHPPHLEYAARWKDAADDHHRGRVLEEARAYLRAWKVRETPAVGDGSTEDDWIVRDGEGYEAEQVARKFNTTVSRVRKLRMADDRDTEFGKKIHGGRAIPRLQDLVERGLGARQIEMLTGVKRSTAQDAINRHRKAA